MNRERILEVLLTMLGAVLLLIASAGKHPYGFYMLLRLVITVGAVYWAWRLYKVGQRVWTWIFATVALLLNPFIPIRMQREDWQPIDLCVGIFLIAWSGYWLFRKHTQAPQRQLPTSSLDGPAYQWKGAGAYQKAGASTGRTSGFTSKRSASPMRASSTKGWGRDSTLYWLTWVAMCLLLDGSLFLPVFSSNALRVVIVVFIVPLAGLQAMWTDSAVYRISWTVVCLLLGGGFSLAVSSPDSDLGRIVVCALAFGGFACAAMLWSRGISKVLFNIGVTNFAIRVLVTGCLIICAIYALSVVGNLAARASTIETELGTNVPVTSDTFRKASEQGNADAQYSLGVSCYEEWESQRMPQEDMQTAFWYRTIRDWRGWINSADPYNRHYTQAVYWLRKAAEQGKADAQYVLGDLYSTGHGPMSMELVMHGRNAQAAPWYRKAAEQGDTDAQNALGDLYDSDEGGLRDFEQAAFWYRMAAAQGSSNAEYMLGNLYRDGDGVSRDYAQAVLWYRKAAEQGDARAQWSLGGVYVGGHGAPRNYAEAYFWYSLAAGGEQDASDSKQVAKYRDEAASHLTPADLSRAQERARKWVEAHQAKPQ